MENLDRLRRFTGSPGEFWPAFIECSVQLLNAKRGILLVRETGQDSWKRLGLWPSETRGGRTAAALFSRAEELADETVHQGTIVEKEENPPGAGRDGVMAGVLLNLQQEEAIGVAVFLLESTAVAKDHGHITFLLKLISEIPASYQLGRMARQAQNDVVQFAEVLDLMVLLNASKRYLGAAMTFCNELAARYRCGCVSLGWLKDGYVRVQAISHMEKFEEKMNIVQDLESAMEEAFDQDEEIVCPPPAGTGFVTREHESFAREQGSGNMVSLPIRLDGEPTGVLTFERAEEPFTEAEIRGLRLCCDQAARRLSDLKRHDRWFGARTATWLKEKLAFLVGVEHTFAKCIGLIVSLALAFLVFGKWNYRVEGPFILQTDDVIYLPAPFEGYIDQVFVQAGDTVNESDPVVTLDTRELYLQESSVTADISRYSREYEKARAVNSLAEMKIAEALTEQARARLEMVRHHVSNARITAPFSGIVVEGDLKKMLGAPVRKGDVLYKIALLDKLYVEIDIDERDVHEMPEKKGTGEIAFVSQPNLKFPITVDRMDPVAVTRQENNVFLLRASFAGEVPEWWRPGMSGVAKINIGKRTLLWIFTHRTVEFLRLWLWW